MLAIFDRVPINKIIVVDRQREDYGDIDDLATSFKKYGQLQPIIIDRNYKLVAGGRRLAAALKLGWTEILVMFKDVADTLYHQELELEENVRRKDLEWQEKERAVARMHDILMQRHENWNHDKTAEYLRVSRRRVFNAIELSKVLDKAESGDPEYADILKADSPTGAMQRLTKIKDIRDRIESAKVRYEAQKLGMTPKTSAQIVAGDALEWMRAQPDESVDVVVTNPPYGVNIEDLYITQKTVYEDDDPRRMRELCRQIVQEAYRILKPNRWLVIFWPTSYLEDLKGVNENMQEEILDSIAAVLEQHGAGPGEIDGLLNSLRYGLKPTFAGFLAATGFKFQKVPAMWCKTGKFLSSLNDPYAQLNLIYETFYFARKGDAKFKQIEHGNVFHHETVPSAERIHALEMPDTLWSEILNMVAVGTETVVEPCCGSGRAGVAALKLGMNYLGIELDPTKAERATMLVREAMYGTTAADATVAPALEIVTDFGDGE